MNRIVGFLAVALAASALAQGKTDGAKTAQAQEKAKSSGAVDWQGQVLKATGSGAPNMKATSPAQARLGAETAAKLDAFRNLISQAKGIQISGGRTVGDEMSRDEVRAKVEGTIRGYKITAKRYFSDGGVEMDVEVPLSALADALVPAAADPKQTQITLKTDGEKTNTGLVIDARALKVVRALSPRLLDAEGKALYAASVLSEDAREKHAAASYYGSLDEATKSALVGEKPLVVKAVRAEGSDLVLDPAEAKKLGEINTAFLAEGRVAIVTQ